MILVMFNFDFMVLIYHWETTTNEMSGVELVFRANEIISFCFLARKYCKRGSKPRVYGDYMPDLRIPVEDFGDL
jgi:hypothetical protein